jgi:hypothetical protein
MIKKGWVEKLDKAAIPNIKNLVDVQKHPGFDPNRDYSPPTTTHSPIRSSLSTTFSRTRSSKGRSPVSTRWATHSRS